MLCLGAKASLTRSHWGQQRRASAQFEDLTLEEAQTCAACSCLPPDQGAPRESAPLSKAALRRRVARCPPLRSQLMKQSEELVSQGEKAFKARA